MEGAVPVLVAFASYVRSVTVCSHSSKIVSLMGVDLKVRDQCDVSMLMISSVDSGKTIPRHFKQRASRATEILFGPK